MTKWKIILKNLPLPPFNFSRKVTDLQTNYLCLVKDESDVFAHWIHFQVLQGGNEAQKSFSVVHKQLHAILHVHLIQKPKSLNSKESVIQDPLLNDVLNGSFESPTSKAIT